MAKLMCGLAGFAGFKALGQEPEIVAREMADAIRHRGPDDQGTWIDVEAEIALAHRRLSIVDLSPAGHQPMPSASGRHVIVFNGEIYNHRELRARLEQEGRGIQWRGSSDTEVLLEAAAAWGLGRALELSVGMFALALFDRETRRLSLARDRLGEKPLYYGHAGGSFLFGSELKALARHPGWIGELDRDAVAMFMETGNVPAPYSIYLGIKKLLPGTILTVDLTTGAETSETYWDVHAIASAGLAHPFQGTAEEAVERTEALLKASIAGQMIADVPLGAFLSGGIDSSTVVALMQSQSARPVRTFSIGFHVEGYDEAQHAKAVAKQLGTEHTELYVSEADAIEVIPRLPDIYCEPFADPSQIPTFLLSKLAREHVTVSLSGDGGDELFGGYSRHTFARSYWPTLRRFPRAARHGIASTVARVSPATWDKAMNPLLAMLPKAKRPPRFGEQLHKAASIAGSDDDEALYRALTTRWPADARPVPAARDVPRGGLLGSGDTLRNMMFRDLIGYLPDDVLAKVDRAAMAVSLETRVPMLDHRLVEFSWSLPDSVLSRGGRSKWPLRHLLSKYVPRPLIDRPKSGFAVPIGTWLRGRLRDWAEGLLAPARLERDGLLDADLVRRMWDDHLSGRKNAQYALWNALMLNAWLDETGAAQAHRAPADPNPAL
jgi:asparagine synthase (glutamine-hydrolysing)